MKTLLHNLVLKPLFALFILLWTSGVADAQGIDTRAKHALLLEVATDEVLFAKAADETFPPASMSKMLTIYIAFEQIATGALSMDDTTVVSDSAWRRWAGTEASLMFLGAGEEVSVNDLLHGIIVSSGNDACTVLAEMLAGTEDSFAAWMNEKAAELGMDNSRFQNASGWPAEDQYTTAHDLARLAKRTVEDFSELYTLYAETEYTYGEDFQTGEPIKQYNRNPLLYRMDGADGLKTGHTEASGYGLTGSAIRDGRRLIAVVSGLDSASVRAREAQSLLEYGFRAFNTYTLFEAGETVAEADVWLGRDGKLPLIAEKTVRMTLSRQARAGIRMVLRHDNPIPAPIEEGQPLATVVVTAPGMEEHRIPLLAGASVEQVGGFGRIGAALEYLLFGSSGGG